MKNPKFSFIGGSTFHSWAPRQIYNAVLLLYAEPYIGAPPYPAVIVIPYISQITVALLVLQHVHKQVNLAPVYVDQLAVPL